MYIEQMFAYSVLQIFCPELIKLIWSSTGCMNSTNISIHHADFPFSCRASLQRQKEASTWLVLGAGWQVGSPSVQQVRSYNGRIIKLFELEETLKAIWSNPPQVLRAPSSLTLDVSRNRASTTSLDNLSWCSISSKCDLKWFQRWSSSAFHSL